ncbi:MAG: hypothetical protein IKT46_00690 [Clostridia bacterium]|nr:hypothetical protein [Clostridia bacterium]
MYLPKINMRSIKRKRTERFYGLDRGRAVEDGYFSEDCNLSARHFPALSTAPKRYELDSYEIVSEHPPLYFRNRDIYCIAALRPDQPFIYSLIKGEKKLLDFDFGSVAGMGNILNFNSKTLMVNKDRAFEFDPKNPSPLTGFFDMGYTLEVEPAHENNEYKERTLRLSVVYEDMSEVGSYSSGTAESDFPAEAAVGDMYAKYLEYYRLIYKDGSDSSKNIWQPVTSVRLRLDIGDGYRRFKEGDYVKLSDLCYWNWSVKKLSALECFVRIGYIDDSKRFVTEPVSVFEDMNMILCKMKYPTNDIGYGSPIIDNEGNCLPLLSGSVSGCMPSMDLICTGANRVWGCSNDNREIYASELGNARNFSVFEGLSGDSYAVTVGSEGDFTACCSYLGSPVFFKETEMILITGSRPAGFTLNSYSVRGVPAHSPAGVCVTGDILYFVSGDGVYAYNGGSISCISDALGDDIRGLRNCVLFGDGDILYLSALCEDKPVQYTYDIAHRIWHKCSTDRVVGYIRYPDAVLAVCHDGQRARFVTLDRGIARDYDLTGAKEEKMQWCWETGDISYSTDKKYLRKLSLDTASSGNSRLYISYDGGCFCEIGSFAPHKRGSTRITVFPQRCDYFRIRMEGDEEMTLYAVTQEIEEVKENG